MVHIAAPGKRVADCAPKACRRTAERLDFRRVVVGFVFKHYKPFFGPAVYIHIHNYARRVYFLANFEIVELTVRTKATHTY